MASAPDPAGDALDKDFVRLRAFWREVEAVKDDAVGGRADAPTARARLRGVLQAQESAVARVASASDLRIYREAQYVMAAAADDVFVRLQWISAGDAIDWMLHPLESELFGSRCAGQEVFRRIDRLGAGDGASTRNLAAVYLSALALGFQGMYAGDPNGEASIAQRQNILRGLIGPPRLAAPLVPQCYEHTLALGPGRVLPSARAWWWAAAAIVGIWLVTSSWLWQRISEALP